MTAMIEDVQIRSDVNVNLLENETKIIVKEITSMSGEVIGVVKLSPEDIDLLSSYLTKPQNARKLIHGRLLYKILEDLRRLYEIKDLKLQDRIWDTKDFLLSYEEYDIVVEDELVLTLVTTPKQCGLKYGSDGNLRLNFDQTINIYTQQPTFEENRYRPEFHKPTRLESFVPDGSKDDTIDSQLYVELLNDSLDAKIRRAFGNFSKEFSLAGQGGKEYPLFETLYWVVRFIQLAYMQKGIKLLGNPQHGSQFFRIGAQLEDFKRQNRKEEFKNLILPILEESLPCIQYPTIGFRID